MAETVTVTPKSGFDDDGNPVAAGTPVVLTPWEIAPGNTSQQYGQGGDLDNVAFTVYFPLRVRTGLDTYSVTDTLIRDDDDILVRGHLCRARVRRWESGGRGGLEVLCQSATGKAA